MPLTNRRPSSFLYPHTVSHYVPTISKDTSGGYVEAPFVLAGQCRAFVQPVSDEIAAIFAQRNQQVTHTVWLESGEVFGAITEADRITYGDNDYKVKAKLNLCELGRAYRLDVEVEVR